MTPPVSLPNPPALLIGLADGLNVSGVTTWANRLAEGLSARGRGVGLVVHKEPGGQRRLASPARPGLRTFDLRELGALDGNLTPAARDAMVEAYEAAVRALATDSGWPVVLSPNLRGDCYGIGASLLRAGLDVRIVGWRHSDIEYEQRVLEHYEPVVTRFCAVSDRIEARLRERLGGRARDIVNLPYGVPTPDRPAARPPLDGRPVRLVYTGRMEHHQKRIMALVGMARLLAERGIEFELELIGDGPASAEVDAGLAGAPGARRLEPMAWPEVAARLDRADAFVLASRFEGLSVSMLEAMARGCVPVVARVASGMSQVVRDGITGIVASVDPGDGDAACAAAMADAVERFAGAGRAAGASGLSAGAHGIVRERYSLEGHLDVADRVIDEAARAPARGWPEDRPLFFDSEGASVPPGGAARLEALLSRLAGRAIVVHGVGAHTRDLRDVLLGSPARIAAFVDDDQAKHGLDLWGRPIISPADAQRAGATDVVISSWMHEEAIWARRSVYERQGLTVWRVYAGPREAQSPAPEARHAEASPS